MYRKNLNFIPELLLIQDLVAGFYCQCPVGMTGELCDLDIDDCQSQPCLNGGHCRDLIGGFRCDCQHGYSGQLCEVNFK